MGGRRGRAEAGCRGPALAVLLLAVTAASVLAPRAEAATTLRAFVVPDLTGVDPADRVTFAIALDNQGPTTAAYAWANLTFPTNTRHMWDTGWPTPYSSSLWASGNRRGYNFTGIPAGTNVTFSVTMEVLAGPADGTQLTVALEVDYTDDTAVVQPRAVTTATLTMRIPNIVVTMTPTETSVNPGTTFSYDITVENTGSTTAGTVWLNDTLPSDVTFNGQSGLPPPRCTNEDCRLSNFGVGTTQPYSLNVTVSPSAPRGAILTNYLLVNFTDPDGDPIPGPTAQASVDVRIVRDLAIAKVALAPVAFPGSTITFRIWYNNSASVALGTTWLNDTLPSGVTHDTSTPVGTVVGSAVLWQFPSVAPGPNVIELVGRVSSTAANGSVLGNRVTADYVDASGVQGLRVEASANVTVSTSLPSFASFAKVASVREAATGDTIRFTIYFNNTGTEAAATAVIEDAIPPGTVLTNPVPAFAPGSSPPRYVWRFSNLAPGDHSLSYDLVIQNAASGTVLNYAFLNYTDQLGQLTYREGPRSASIRVSGGSAVGDSGSLFLLAAAVAGIGVAGFLAYRTVGARKTVIDEVFLLHKDGLLIKHYTRRVRPDVDSDILSGMLIAVQNFVNESFIGAEGLQREGKLDELRFGEFKMVIERGQWVVVAAVLSGDPTNRVKDEVKAAIRDLEAALGEWLEGWSGEMKQVEGADAYIQDLIAGTYRRAWGKG